MVKPQPSKLVTRVRFPPPAPLLDGIQHKKHQSPSPRLRRGKLPSLSRDNAEPVNRCIFLMPSLMSEGFLPMYTVYILHSEKSNRYYTGFTHNLQARLKKHRSGQNRSTSFANDWRVVWKIKKEDSLEAREKEIQIKKRGAERFLLESKE
jgi:putative endonuclease